MDLAGLGEVVAEVVVEVMVVAGGVDAADAEVDISVGVEEGFADSSGRAAVGLAGGGWTPLMPTSSVSKTIKKEHRMSVLRHKKKIAWQLRGEEGTYSM